MARILYITYDGLLEPLGQSQVLQYLKHLSAAHRIVLLSYEKARDWSDVDRRNALLRATKAAGIRWIPLRYHGRPSGPATAWDVAVGFAVSLCCVLRYRIAAVHARSYVPSVIALGLKKLLGVGFIFDMRGFWADERAERAGLGRESGLYRTAKWFESRFFQNADVVVSLTHAGVSAVKKLPYLRRPLPAFEVIPTCTNLESFRAAAVPRTGGFTLGYVGSADTAYMFEPVLRCFKILLEKQVGARLLVVTRSSHDRLSALLREFGIPEGRVEIKSVAPDRVAAEMARMDAGIFFVKPGFSTCASVPTKLGEFLACGVPCLGNSGVGDLEGILEGHSVGVVLREFSPEAEEAAVSSLLDLCGGAETGKRCEAVAARFFSLQAGVKSYDGIYRALCGADP